MALTGTGAALGDAIATAIKTLSPAMTDQQFNQLKAAWEQIGPVIVAHIVANAVVSSTGTATVTTAPGVAPVTTTGGIT